MVRARLVQAAVEARVIGDSGANRVDGYWQRRGRCSEAQGSTEAGRGK